MTIHFHTAELLVTIKYESLYSTCVKLSLRLRGHYEYFFSPFNRILDHCRVTLSINSPVSGGDSGLQIGRSGFEPWPGHFVVFLGKILYSHSDSLHPGV